MWFFRVLFLLRGLSTNLLAKVNYLTVMRPFAEHALKVAVRRTIGARDTSSDDGNRNNDFPKS